jgi:hypothetical protein
LPNLKVSLNVLDRHVFRSHEIEYAPHLNLRIDKILDTVLTQNKKPLENMSRRETKLNLTKV